MDMNDAGRTSREDMTTKCGLEGSKRCNKRRLDFPYRVDYNDHFETSIEAYEDIMPVLDGLSRDCRQSRQEHKLYDPYFCNGRTKVLLNQLGFEKVFHEKRDFYSDIEKGLIPDHDTLITNPPYSEQHKEKCLTFCLDQFKANKTPFLLLMPSYVATRSYFGSLLDGFSDDIVYVVPSTRYEYDHPEGTGHEASPFHSIWFCCVGKDRVPLLQKALDEHEWTYSRQKPKLVTSITELEELGTVTTKKRPNPKQRKKRRRLKATEGSGEPCKQLQAHPEKPDNSIEGNQSNRTKSSKKNSKYRDVKGKREKKRF